MITYLVILALLCGACQSPRCPLAQSAVPLVCGGEENQVFSESITHFFSAGVRPQNSLLGPGPEINIGDKKGLIAGMWSALLR